MYNITNQQIEAFLTIAMYMNLSNAADAMYISQPALSKTLQRFEERIGVRLFLRGSKGLSLTSQGEYLYSVLKPLYTSMNEAIDEARAIQDRPAKNLRIVHASVYDVAEIFLEAKACLRRFSESHPDIVLTESLGEYKEIRNALAYGHTDIAIIYDFVLDQMKNVSYKRITEFPLYLAMSAEHPLAKNNAMPPAEMLAEEVFYRVSFLDDETSLQTYEDECRQVGFVPKQYVFVSNMQTLFHAIREMKGMSLCTKFSHFGSGDDIKYYELPSLRDKKYIVAAWQTDRLTAEARQLIGTIPGEEIKPLVV